MATQSNLRTPNPGANSPDAEFGSRYFGDFYHHLMTASWPYLLFLITAAFAVINCLFAVAYLLDGGVENARPGSFADMFFFSVQTMATMGYGKLAPATLIANLLMSVEALSGLVSLALVTGLIFAKFSRPTARVRRSRRPPLGDQPVPWFEARGVDEAVLAALFGHRGTAEQTPEALQVFL